MKRRVLALAVMAVGVVAIAGTALGGHQTSGVKSYTGCLVSGDGVIIKVKEGNAPRSACTGGQVEAHFSGGDITEIAVTGALTLGSNGGENGKVTIALKPEFSLPQSCAAGRVAEWSGSAWVCGVDNDTTYAAGTGLDLSSSNVFSIEPGYRLPGKECPAAGTFVRGFDSGGAIQCAAPTAAPTGIEVWQKVRPAAGIEVRTPLPKGEGVDLVTMPLPAGTYLVTALATVGGHAGEIQATCRLRTETFASYPVHAQGINIDEGAFGSAEAVVTVHGVISLSATDAVRFTCTSEYEEGQATRATVTAIKVERVHTP